MGLKYVFDRWTGDMGSAVHDLRKIEVVESEGFSKDGAHTDDI